MLDAPRPTASHDHAFDLCPQDAAAFEALIHAEFSLERVPVPLRERARCVASMLNVLDIHHADHSATPASADGADPLLVHATLVAVSRADQRVESLTLCPADEDALESLVSARFACDKVPPALRARARHHARMLEMLGDMTAGSPSSSNDLLARTLAFVQRENDESQSRMRLAPAPEAESVLRRRPRLQFSDLVAAASVALIGGAVLVPMLGAVRDTNRRMACQANMMSAGLGFGQYASDFRESLPLATASPAGSRWWDVGTPEHSNSANLFTLARTNYARLSDLACHGNPRACASQDLTSPMDWRSEDQVSYSYQNMFATERTRWVQQAKVVVLVDRSPIIPLARLGMPIDPMASSLNHAGRGQNILLNDGSSRFIRSPVLENYDNVFLPRAIERLIAERQQARRADPLSGTESPESAEDVFVGP